MLEMEQVNDINRRIRLFRKEDLKLSQREFAEKLGLKQTSLSSIENGAANVSERNIKEICRVFKVNEKWLRTGEGEMFTQTNDNLIDEVAKQYNLGEGSKMLMEMFLNFNAEQRETILNFIDDFTARWQAKQKQAAAKTNKVDINSEVAELLQKYLSLDDQSREKIKSDLDYEYERSKTFAEESSDAATES